jgi:hypothetical protein
MIVLSQSTSQWIITHGLCQSFHRATAIGCTRPSSGIAPPLISSSKSQLISQLTESFPCKRTGRKWHEYHDFSSMRELSWDRHSAAARRAQASHAVQIHIVAAMNKAADIPGYGLCFLLSDDQQDDDVQTVLLRMHERSQPLLARMRFAMLFSPATEISAPTSSSAKCLVNARRA